MAKRATRDFHYEFGDFVDNEEVPHISIGQNIHEPGRIKPGLLRTRRS